MNDRADYFVIGMSLAGISAALTLSRSGKRVVLIDYDRDTDSIVDVPLFLDTPLGSSMTGLELDLLARNVLRDAGVEIRFDCHVTAIRVDGRVIVECDRAHWESSGLIFAPNGTEPGLTIERSVELQGFGVSFSAAADASFYPARPVAVYGDAPRVFEHAYMAARFAAPVLVLVKHAIDDGGSVLLQRLRSMPSIEIIDDVRLVSLRSNGKALSEIEFESRGGRASVAEDALFVAQDVEPDFKVLGRGSEAPILQRAGLAAGISYWRHDALVADGERAAKRLLALR